MPIFRKLTFFRIFPFRDFWVQQPLRVLGLIFSCWLFSGYVAALSVSIG